MQPEDIAALRRFLSKMPPDARIDVGMFICSASELLEVVDDALVRRATRGKEPTDA
jgi:hypothetical protein